MTNFASPPVQARSGPMVLPAGVFTNTNPPSPRQDEKLFLIIVLALAAIFVAMPGDEQRTDNWRRDERENDPENNKSEQRHGVPPAMAGFHTRQQARMQARRGIIWLYGGMGFSARRHELLLRNGDRRHQTWA
jgi:hypothetical protein